jgi:undecaprenyl phosphate N,N'-diacetylbacillosamine 1-phosphate transferase|tara:strand:- start:10 stop:612 length:603 start_codon:yes stop_codon:yes gene_type:complete
MIKRLFDFICSIFLIIVCSPLFIITSIFIKFTLGSPIFFTQKRPGLNEKIFTIYKFRTMSELYDSDGILLPDSKRLSKVGNFIRSLSLDELPTLLNIIKGDMSLVGPRPLLIEYLCLYSEEQKKRHLVKPGITGLAQINGRNLLDWEEKFNYDVLYVENHNFFLDIKILFITIKKVALREGISSQNEMTTEPFTGRKKND